MSLMLKVPTHLDGRNPIVGRYTARELVPVVAGAFGAAGVLGQPHLPAPVRVGEALAVVALGGAAGLVRPAGRSLVAWGRLATAHLLGHRISAWLPPAAPFAPVAPAPDTGTRRPPHLPAATGMGIGTGTLALLPPRPGGATDPVPVPGHARRPATHGHPFVPAEIVDDTITFADGRRCAVLECDGANVEGMDTEQQQTLHAAYHAVLLGLSFPVQMLVCADPVDLGPYIVRRMERLGRQPLAVRRLGSADAAYMRRALARSDALDQRVYVVIPAGSLPAGSSPAAPAPDGAGVLTRVRPRRRSPVGRRHGAEVDRLLAEQCATIREGLARAGVHAWRLDTAALRQLYYRRLCPRTARLQPLDDGHVAPVATARALFTTATDDATTDGENDEEEDDDDA